MAFKELAPLSAALILFLAATFPRPIFVKVLREAHLDQLIARLCLVALGLLALWGWYRIKT
jgi:hypothetical protein